jgi:hypothetical protein
MGGGVGGGGNGKAGHGNSRAKHQTKCLHGFYSWGQMGGLGEIAGRPAYNAGPRRWFPAKAGSPYFTMI